MLASKQKQALWTIPIPTLESELSSKELCVLFEYVAAIYIYIYNVFNVMFKAKIGSIPGAFQNTFHFICMITLQRIVRTILRNLSLAKI